MSSTDLEGRVLTAAEERIQKKWIADCQKATADGKRGVRVPPKGSEARRKLKLAGDS